MNGKTHAYLDLAALPAVGAVILDQRPAFVFRGDGRGILWANAAAAEFLGEATMGAVLEREFSSANPLSRQLARLARLLPSEHARIEMLRFSFGVRQEVLPSACVRLNLSDGSSAVLAVAAAAGTSRESIVTRAERLSDVIAGKDWLAAVLGEDGRVLGASGSFARLAPASADIDALMEKISAGRERIAKHAVRIDGETRLAGVARLETAVGALFLLIVGPPDVKAEPAPKVAVRRPPDASGRRPDDSEMDIERALGAPETDPSQKKKRAERRPERDKPAASPPRQPVPASAPETLQQAEPIAVVPSAAPPESQKPIAATSPAEGPLEPTRPPSPIEADEPEVADDLDDAARISIEQGLRIVASREATAEPPPEQKAPTPARAPEPAPERSNVVRLPGIVAPPRVVTNEGLSGTEQDAFRRIAEALGARGESRDRRTAEDAAAGAGAGKKAKPDSEAAKGEAPDEIETRVLDRLPIGLVISRDRQTLFANRTLLDMLGYDSVSAFAAAGGAESLFPGETDWGKAGAGNGRMNARRRDGSLLPVEARLHAVPWGKATALMLSLRELPKTKTAEASPDDLIADIASRESRVEELETILDTATDGVVVIDGRGRIGNLNRSAEALFGIEANDVLGHPFTELLAEESHKAALDYLDGLAANGVASVLNDGREVIGKVPHGGLIPLFMTMGRLGETGKFCAVLRDITQWKNAEEELVAARRAAEQANQQKSDFLAKISHEIRTPLNAIIGFSEVMIEERFGAIGNERYRDYLRDIHVSGAHLMSLINDLLDLSKIEAGKLELAFEAVAVNEVIQECVALMQPQANRQRIIIRTSLSSGVPNVVADPRSLRQILLNLLSNAIKFTPSGGQVIVSTALEDDGQVVIRVRDTGIGMSEKDIETALKPFRQLATSRTGRGEGTGLGLPLTKALVEANRASFAIDSAVSQGTLVRITFPTTRVLAG
jgi:PAS domain S-box-containing protein